MMRLSDQWEIINRYRQSAPVDVYACAVSLGIEVKEAWLGADVSGMLERGGIGYKITINASDAETRKRFTLAHELGHFMLHRHLIDQGLDDDRAYRSTSVGRYHNTAIGPKEETEANRFAADVLMPRDLINRHRSGKTADQMADLFGVSRMAMEIRLGT